MLTEPAAPARNPSYLKSDDEADQVVAYGPASLSNLGPGFDVLGLALAGVGDRVTACYISEPGIDIVIANDPCGNGIPADAEKNTAGVAAREVLRQAGSDAGVRLTIHKEVPCGSGLGGSASSAVAGAMAVNALLASPFPKEYLVEAVLAGEAVASGARHGDNVVPALLGGLILLDPTDPRRYRPVPIAGEVYLAVVVPELEILTREARQLLPAAVTLGQAVAHASRLAHLVAAFAAGDLDAVGRMIMSDELVEPRRAALLPCYSAIKQAALDAGACGCALSGSGPALFAVSPDEAATEVVLTAMVSACRKSGISATSYATLVDRIGARVL